MKQKTCKKCGGTYSEVFFASKGDKVGGTRTSRRTAKTCRGCQQTVKDERKRRNRPLAKARNTFYSHARKFIAKGLATSRIAFGEMFGWDVHQMAHDIEHAFANGCPYCHRPFSEMGHGLADVTLDIVDPEKLPYYGVNTKWICATENKEKQRTPPDQWGAKLVAWAQWRKRQEELEVDPYAGTLFEGLNSFIKIVNSED